MNLAETISQAAYGKSASVEAPENQLPEWRDGYAEGLAPQSDDPMQTKWLEIGCPNPIPRSWYTWKRGYWAGVFTRLANELPSTST
jgi:hypothetical protein